MFEIFRRDGYGKQKIFDADDIEEVARISAEMSGMKPEDLLTEEERSDLEVFFDD